MAHENISFREAVRMKKLNLVNSASSFSDKILNNKFNNNGDIVQKAGVHSSVAPPLVTSFPPLPNHTKHIAKTQNHPVPLKPKFRSHPATVYSPPSSPNGSFLEYVLQQNVSKDRDPDWISSFANSLTLSLSNFKDIPPSPSALSSLIQSTIIKLLSSPSNDDVTY